MVQVDFSSAKAIVRSCVNTS